jgi:hypothetical protein
MSSSQIEGYECVMKKIKNLIKDKWFENEEDQFIMDEDYIKKRTDEAILWKNEIKKYYKKSIYKKVNITEIQIGDICVTKKKYGFVIDKKNNILTLYTFNEILELCEEKIAVDTCVKLF